MMRLNKNISTIKKNVNKDQFAKIPLRLISTKMKIDEGKKIMDWKLKNQQERINDYVVKHLFILYLIIYIHPHIIFVFLHK